MNRIASCLLGLALVAGAASAAVKPSEVDAVMRAHDWQRAERMLQDVIADKPNLAKPHYYLAQVFEQEHRPDMAALQLAAAERLDPQLKFTKSPSKYYAMKSRLAAAAGPSTAPAARPMPSYAPTHPLPDAPAARSKVSGSDNAGHSGGWGFLVVLVMLAAAGTGLWLVLSRKAKRAQEDADTRDRREELKLVMERKDALDKALLDAKLAGAGASFVAQEMTRLSARLMEHAEALQRTSSTWKVDADSRRQVMRQAREVLVLAESGQYDRAPRPPEPVAAPAAAPAFIPSQAPVSSMPAGPVAGSSPATVQTVVVEHHDSGLGSALETAMLLDVLSNHGSSREHVVERVVEREVPVYYQAPEPQREDRVDAQLDLSADDERSSSGMESASVDAQLDLDTDDDRGGWGSSASDSGSDAQIDTSSSSSDGGSSWD